MTGFFDMSEDEFQKLNGGFWDMPGPFQETEPDNQGGRRDPLTASSFGEGMNIAWQNGRDNGARTLQNLPDPVKIALGAAGKVMQPFAAPQQLLFAGIKATGDLFDGDDETSAWETMKRGGRSALSYVTFGGYQAAGLGQGDPRAQHITGYELFKKTGAPNWVARWAGTAADFFLDVPLVGALGKAAKMDKLTAGLRIGENMAQSFDSPAALRAFAGGVVAAPFTTQPIKRFVEAVPQGVRQAGRETLVDPILNLRHVPKSDPLWPGAAPESVPVKPTLGQTWLSRDRGVPAPVAGAQQRQNAVMSQYAVLNNEALSAFDKARRGLPLHEEKLLDSLVARLADESNDAARAGIEGQIRAMETRTGRAGLFDDAIRATNKGVQFDHFAATKLHAAALMTEDALKGYLSGDARHLRRVFTMYGENAGDQLRRLMDRDAPASVTFDRAATTRLYSATLNPTLPPAPPARAFIKATPTRASQFPGKVDVLDPVADAEKLVWRPVTREIEVGTVDRGGIDLGNLGRSEITSLRNVLGWNAIVQQGGKWRMAGGVTDTFPVGHPVIQQVLGDLKEQGLAKDVRVEPTTLKEQVPNYYNPNDPAPMDVQRALSNAEVDEAGGALYVHNSDLTAFMAGATDDELAAFNRALETLPLRERTRQVGRNTVEDTWFPVNPTDPAMQRLIGRARGGNAALFDGATGQPSVGAVLPTKSNPKLPTPEEFSDAMQRAYTNADQHPADFLNAFLRERGMTEAHIARVIEGIGKEWAEKAGINWKPSDAQIVRHFTRDRASRGGGENLGTRNTTAVTTQRQEISDWYADALGEVESFTQRITKQAQTVSKATTTTQVIQDVRKYLLDNDLIERIDTADMGAIHKTAALRVINADQAAKLGNGFREGDVIPSEIHRILVETVTPRKDAPLGLAWQWYSSRWQGVKLANPASILTNLRSGFVMADHAGHSVPGLMRGMADFLRLHRAAMKGDGALDTTANVNGVTMREMFDTPFIHNTMMNAEVVQQSSRLMDELANAGSSNALQRGVASLQDWLTNDPRGVGVSRGYAKAVTPMRWLGDTYGRVDSLMKGGLYMSLRKQGMKAEDAARIADETFFNYQNVPYVVDGLRRLGLLGMPFASFKFLAAGRWFKSMYTNPYGVQRYYRLPNSSRAAMQDEEGEPGNDTSALQEYDAGSPDFIRQALYIPLGRDSEGRVRAVKLDDILPETAVFDAFNADGVAGTIPPAVQLIAQIVTGKGYQGRDVYRTGENWAETQRLAPREAARGVTKALWQFGAYPWAPGQPMTERIVKAIADKSVPVDTIGNPTAQAVLKLLSEGPAAGLDPMPFTPERKGAQPVPDVHDALVRVLGIKTYPVSLTPGEPGTYQSNLIGVQMNMNTINKLMTQEMKAATTDEQRREIRARYDAMRQKVLQRVPSRE